MRLEARDLRLIEAVAEEGSLTRAGTRLNATQPALSRHLKELEDRIRLPLFERAGRRMIPTAAGVRLRQRAQAVLATLDLAENEVRALQGQGRTTLRLSTDCYTSYHWLPRVLQRLAALHPAVDVRIEFDLTRQTVPALLAGKLDLALVTGVKSDRRIVVQPMFADEHVALVPPHHPWAQRRRVSPEDFSGENLFMVPPPEDSDVLKDFLAPAGVRPREIHTVALTEAMVAMVDAGFGVGTAPRWTVGPQLRSGRLVGIRLGRGLRRHWGVARRRTAPGSPALDAFIAILAQTDPSDDPV